MRNSSGRRRITAFMYPGFLAVPMWSSQSIARRSRSTDASGTDTRIACSAQHPAPTRNSGSQSSMRRSSVTRSSWRRCASWAGALQLSGSVLSRTKALRSSAKDWLVGLDQGVRSWKFEQAHCLASTSCPRKVTEGLPAGPLCLKPNCSQYCGERVNYDRSEPQGFCQQNGRS